VRKKGVGAGNVLFGLLRVNFVVHLIVFETNREKAYAVNAAGGGPYGGIVQAYLEPDRIAGIN
jgi:hypothetical protein